MNPSPSANTWPQPQTVAAWYQPFPTPPCRILVGTIQLQQVELLLQHSHREPLGPIPLNMARCLELRDGFTVRELAEQMQLADRLVRSTLDAMRRQGDVTETPNGVIRLTDAGRDAIEHGTVRTDRHRQTFEFRNGRYLGENASRLVPGPSEPSDFDGTEALRQARPELHIVAPNVHDWMSVPLYRVVAKPIVLTEDDDVRICFVDWRHAPGPIGRTTMMAKEHANALFPELSVSESALRECWTAWAASRRVPLDGYAESRLTLDCHELRVEPEPKLSAWLAEHRADAYSRETWLWLGDGELRQPVRLDLKATHEPDA